MRDLSELGMKPRRRTGPLPSPTDEEIHAFESHFNVRLPADYQAFLRTCNGGNPTAGWFVTKSGYRSCIGSFHYLLPEDPQRLDLVHHPDGWEFGNIWAETRELRKTILRVKQELPAIREISTEQIIPFAYDNGNSSVFAFDVRHDPPSVCEVVVSDGFRVVPLMDSFAELVDLLYEDTSLRRSGRTRPPTIRLLSKSGGTAFPYDAALALIRGLPGVVISPAKVAPPTSGNLELSGGRKARLSEATVRSMEEMAVRAKCFDFLWNGPPRVRGTLFENMLFIRVTNDEAGTVALVKSWGDQLDLSVVVH